MKLPKLISGPILRRVTPDHVYIWLALTTPLQVRAVVYKISQAYSYEKIDTQTVQKRTRLGKNLYIYLLEISPQIDSFPSGSLLGYNLNFSNPFECWDLGDLDLLSSDNPNSIVYNELKYPSFYIDNTTNPNILYGSCRKLHGKGEDALAKGDLILEKNTDDLAQRPSALFMMGDQIYADDVAGPIFPFIQKLGEALIGREEPLGDVNNQLYLEPFRTSLKQINGRAYISKNFCHFTSQHVTNHLMKFSEYVAMYILSWSTVAWDLLQDGGSLESFEDMLNHDHVYFVFPNIPQYKKQHRKERKKLEKQYNDQMEDLVNFQKALPRVQRLLANIPTYMIFDDHDLTDDWNLTQGWKDNVRDASLGRHVIANGLTAYWAFQGWGNDPSRFDESFIQPIEKYLANYDIRSPQYELWCNQLWTFQQWYFVAPTKPKALFLDTRTMRQYDPFPEPVKLGGIIEETARSPELINQSAYPLLSDTLKQANWQSGDELILIAPSPFYGVELIEEFLRKAIHPLRALGLPIQSRFDMEEWEDNDDGVLSFHRWLASLKPGRCFILSGDVHYAFGVYAHYRNHEGYEHTYYQLTSSPMKNMSFFGFWGYLMQKLIRLSAFKSKYRAMVRYSDHSNHMTYLNKKKAMPKDIQWREKIHYLISDKNVVVYFDNNLGWLWGPPVTQSSTLLLDNINDAEFEV